MDTCKYAVKYIGARPPKCGGDDGPCGLCELKWDLQEVARKLDIPLFDLKGRDANYVLRLYYRLGAITNNVEYTLE